MDWFVFVIWFLFELVTVLWNVFVFVVVLFVFFNKAVREAAADFAEVVIKTIWRNVTHIHWYKTVKLEEDHTQGNLVILRMKLCRCGSIKTRTEAL